MAYSQSLFLILRIENPTCMGQSANYITTRGGVIDFVTFILRGGLNNK